MLGILGISIKIKGNNLYLLLKIFWKHFSSWYSINEITLLPSLPSPKVVGEINVYFSYLKGKRATPPSLVTYTGRTR